MSDTLTVMFVCTANICRSAYADVYARALGHRWPHLRFQSAGIYGLVGEPMCESMATEASNRGANPEGFVARRITPAMINDVDLVLTAEAGHRTFLIQERPSDITKVFTLTQFRESIADAPLSVTGRDLIAYARTASIAARTTGDVADPYRRGPEAAQACAREIDDLLLSILPRLSGQTL